MNLRVVSYRNSTSNHNPACCRRSRPCVVSYRNSTSNHNPHTPSGSAFPVVSYRNSTSNHNRRVGSLSARRVVSYRNSTSNHNCGACVYQCQLLYLIEILHQTTTPGYFSNIPECCILSKFYIKPQRSSRDSALETRCILSKFYIKPQPMDDKECLRNRCILSKFYIKPQHPSWISGTVCCCILSKFYIKPQLLRLVLFCLVVVSYRNSTSNHNPQLLGYDSVVLYLIEILHQTTTSRRSNVQTKQLYLIEILHQTTTYSPGGENVCSVVSYRNSTSNHNPGTRLRAGSRLYLIEILHQTTTGEHIQVYGALLYLIEILHQTTTSHSGTGEREWLYLIEILHQTTTPRRSQPRQKRCILSKFYIKPQHGPGQPLPKPVVSYRNSTSNHNSF